MQAIVTCDNNWGISFKGRDIVSIPGEAKSRMQQIAGQTVIYDVDYVKNLPGAKPITGCNNIIYTAGKDINIKDADCVKSIAQVKLKALSIKDSEVYIIHGAELYNELLNLIDTFHVTKVDYVYETDEHIENLDLNKDFEITADSDEQYCFDIVYNYLKYERK